MNCPNIDSLDSRFIDVSWNSIISKKYPTSLLIKSIDNILKEIISRSNITIESINTIKSDQFLYELTVLVESKEKLDKYINDLNGINGVISVERLIR